jgi:hypothetical protein
MSFGMAASGRSNTPQRGSAAVDAPLQFGSASAELSAGRLSGAFRRIAGESRRRRRRFNRTADFGR